MNNINNRIIPAVRHRWRMFEARERVTARDGGSAVEYLTPTLNEQIDEWIGKSGARLIDPGRVSLHVSGENALLGVTVTRTVAVAYAAAVEHNPEHNPEQEQTGGKPENNFKGRRELEVGAVPVAIEPPQPTPADNAGGLGDAGGRGKLGLPRIQ